MEKQKTGAATPTKVANKGAPLGPKATKKVSAPSGRGGSNINLNTRVWVSEDSESSGLLAALPPQLAKALEIVVNDFEGNCTLGQLDEAWQKSNNLDVNGGPYTQGIKARPGQNSFWTHYISGTSFKNNLTKRKPIVAFGIDNISKYFKLAN
tara:strand:+ start:64 stop:519 length:456 start_codon:yes stop_codon:yes gene_type:complete